MCLTPAVHGAREGSLREDQVSSRDALPCSGKEGALPRPVGEVGRRGGLHVISKVRRVPVEKSRAGPNALGAPRPPYSCPVPVRVSRACSRPPGAPPPPPGLACLRSTSYGPSHSAQAAPSHSTTHAVLANAAQICGNNTDCCSDKGWEECLNQAQHTRSTYKHIASASTSLNSRPPKIR